VLSVELLKKIKLIEITTRKCVNDLMSGQYKSHFKGHGVQFSEHRVYVSGDDVRHIDWKASARTREPLVKKFEEERELTVLLIVDGSGSQFFGSNKLLKSEVTANIGGMLAAAATHTGDRVGAIFFGGEVEKIIPPKKGKHPVLHIIQEILTYRPKTKGTNLAAALDASRRLLKHSGVVFILSDFLTENYERPLKRLCRKHDVVAISIEDEREEIIPDIGRIRLADPETGEKHIFNTGSYSFKKWFQDFKSKHEGKKKETLRGKHLDYLKIKTEEDFADVLVRFFKNRRRSH
jgi:uncharacterized protein (DUF58 family)